jgi:hypothetical protein
MTLILNIMKKYTLLTVLLFGLITQKSNAQATLGGSNNTVPGDYIGSQALATLTDVVFRTNGYNTMNLLTSGDLNITGFYNGYRIGLQQVLYTGGDGTSIYVGQQIPNTYSYFMNQYNTCTGYGAGINMYTLASYGSYNTFTGAGAGYNDKGNGSDYTGCFNTLTGWDCGYSNILGKSNSYYGKAAGYHNNGDYNCMFGGHSGDGYANGDYLADSNVFMGNYSAFNMSGTLTGDGNVIIGNSAGYVTGENIGCNYNVFEGFKACTINPGGDSNIVIGYNADAYVGSSGSPSVINNAIAIGAGAIVNYNNQVIVGNNKQYVGIGESSDYPNGGPQWNLELCTEHDPTGTGGFYNTINGYPFLATGFSGLRFRDLTSGSVPIDIGALESPPTGVLSLDPTGKVIYITPPSASLGTCTLPTNLTPGTNGAINLNGSNFEFQGNSAGSAVDNVSIGWGACVVPPAKLTVLQNSGSSNTLGLYVENDDVSTASSGSPVALYGIKSFLPTPASPSYYNVAGWFEADGIVANPLELGSTNTYGYAIFVPGLVAQTLSGNVIGGTVDIGYPFQTDIPDYLLDVDGVARITGGVVPSDSILKKNVAPFKYGLKAIRNLNPVSYNYNGIGGFDQSTKYIGLIAQNLQRNVPSAVMSSHIIKDTISHDTATILNIYDQAVMYTAVNAIKQLDSTVTAKSIKIDSLTNTLDSLRDAFKNIQSCLNTLCNNGGHAPTHHGGGSGNSGDSNTAISNIQEVTLSALSATPLLYQNTPNPFSTGTKINYYLPSGTIGATIVFYDTYGNQLKTVQLSQTGNGTINITPDNLTSGIYSYSLVVNNIVIDTKRMLLQK